MAFVAFANGERPASNIERASFAGFDLKKEKNRKANIGLTVTRPTWQGSITSFFSRIDDYILICQGIRSENVDVHRIGVELDFVKQLTPFWRLFGSMAWIRAQNLTGHGSGSVPLAQTPPLDGRFGVIYEHGTFAATFAGRAVIAQTRIDPGYGNSLGIDNPDPTPGFATANMSMTWKPVKQTQLSLGIDNIFDLTYYEHLSRRIGDVPPGFVNFGRLNEPGRAFWFRIVLNTVKKSGAIHVAAGPGVSSFDEGGDLDTHGHCTLRAKFIRSLLHITSRLLTPYSGSLRPLQLIPHHIAMLLRRRSKQLDQWQGPVSQAYLVIVIPTFGCGIASGLRGAGYFSNLKRAL